MPKTKVSVRVRIDAYEVIARAVEEGVAYGYQRAHKYVAKPDEYQLRETIEQAVLSSLCEVLKFDDGEAE